MMIEQNIPKYLSTEAHVLSNREDIEEAHAREPVSRKIKLKILITILVLSLLSL